MLQKGWFDMAKLKSKKWWSEVAERSIKTIAQTALATIGTAAVITDVNWIVVGSAALLAGVLSVLTSIAGLKEKSE